MDRADGGPSASRNRGIRRSKGDVVIILDDDVLPHMDLVEQHWRYHLKHPEPEAAALGNVYVPQRLLDDPMSLFHTFPYYEVENQNKLDYLHFWTCNVSFKRDFMLKKAMFPEDMLYFEDVAVSYKLEKLAGATTLITLRSGAASPATARAKAPWSPGRKAA
ncbi:MAG: glycosyltransferase family A protein [Edaphobacter sp.]